MEDLKGQIQRKLIAGIIEDKCKNSSYIIFKESWCTQERVIRFTTPFFRSLFDVKESAAGKWHTGDLVMYEVLNDIDRISVKCILSNAAVPYVQADIRENLCRALGKDGHMKDEDVELFSWDTAVTDNINNALAAFDTLLAELIHEFEADVIKKLDQAKEESRRDSVIMEGEQTSVLSTKYERNPKARQQCLDYYGTACAVCGIDFGKAYGPEFEGKIEVHHVVPLHEIGEEYEVDPIKDLIPVCPNCHMALHSKKNGVYTVRELKELRSKTKAAD